MGSSTSGPSPPAPELPDHEVQARLAEAVRAYARRVLEGDALPPFPEDHDVGQTEVAIAAAAMLKQVEVYSFELATMFNV
jgi:hypothetical protein